MSEVHEREGFEPNSRQSEILKVISETGFAETEAIARYFSKTTQTIRRDFQTLEKYGYVKRVHGGACAQTHGIYQNRPYLERQSTNLIEKQLIGKTAAELIPDDQCVFLSLGTSTEAVARNLLHHKNMRFVTNNLNIAQLLRDNPTSETQICGGVIRAEDGGLLDPRAIDLIDNLRTDFGVIGIGAIADDGGLFCYSIDEVRAAQAIIRNSSMTILVADEQKFGWQANYKMGHLGDVNVFVTGKIASPQMTQICSDQNVKIVQVSRRT